ncbi:MAG: ChaN family lipoprotein [Proteobacteria bacterium]|jgi:hypothetical protein|nr:ChaN family lipoprotein [Pseudomonadota bacterium]
MALSPVERQSIRIRKSLYQQVMNHVTQLLGGESKGVSKYRRQFENEFRKRWKVAELKEIMAEIEEAQVVYLADFHALQQSQKAHMRILRLLRPHRQRYLLLECFEARHQKSLDLYMAGKISERDLLKAVEWKKNWGFPWEHYRPLLRWAYKSKVRVFGINLASGERTAKSLHRRDQFAATKVSEILSRFPEAQAVVIFGDWHLAPAHLPREVRKRFPTGKDVIVYQNSERLYFSLLEKNLDHSVDIVKLQKGVYCLQNVPPWVKWQNFLIYLESNSDLLLDEEDLDWTDDVAKYVSLLASDLGLRVPVDSFSVYSSGDDRLFEILGELPEAQEQKWFRGLVEEEVSFYLPELKVAYLGRPTVNQAAALAMSICFCELSRIKSYPWRMPSDFHKLIWWEAIQYFGSKLLNPKRKTDSLSDLRAGLQAKSPADRGREALQLALAQKMKDLLYLSGMGEPRSLPRPRKAFSYREAARLLGGLMGEKMYFAYRKRWLTLKTLTSLLRKTTDSENFEPTYLEILEILENWPEPFKSKRDKL